MYIIAHFIMIFMYNYYYVFPIAKSGCQAVNFVFKSAHARTSNSGCSVEEFREQLNGSAKLLRLPRR